MSGLIRFPKNDISHMSARQKLGSRSSSLNPLRNQFNPVQEVGEDIDIEELLHQVDALKKENKALKDSNRRHMPYNMQVMLLKAEESQVFFQEKLEAKEQEVENLHKKCKALDARCHEAFEIQQEMESAIEDYENNTRRWEDQLKSSNMKLHELQKKYSNLEKQKKSLQSKAEKLEFEK